MDIKKGKSITTSVPTISIKFHANNEQVEELYVSDDEQNHSCINKQNVSPGTTPSSSFTGSTEAEGSPLKFLPRLVKRSTSIDVSHGSNIDSTTPSDPWRFFSDIKGKITKSVEDKITEIKAARSQEEGSPSKNKLEKTSKDNSSLSDSEDLSESSISKTCGIVSTTEGVEMSSDEDTPSLEKDKDKKSDSPKLSVTPSVKPTLRQRFRMLKSRGIVKEGTVSIPTLSKLCNINSDRVEQVPPEQADEIESGVDALEESTFHDVDGEKTEEVLEEVSKTFDNIEMDGDKVLNVREVTGQEIRNMVEVGGGKGVKTVFSPSGFVDLRWRKVIQDKDYTLYVIGVLILLYFVIHHYYSYGAGLLLGIFISVVYFKIKLKLSQSVAYSPKFSHLSTKRLPQQIFEIPPVKEYQPLLKYEGWVNEYPEQYNPHTYHICQTQPVYLKLQGNLLRISNTTSKVPKRAMWDEPLITKNFTSHRVYNLLDAKITLLPEGLAKIRHWSKKYPICISLNKEQLTDEETLAKMDVEPDEKSNTKPASPKRKSSFTFRKRKSTVIPMSQRFSKLTEEEEDYELDSDISRSNSPSPTSGDLSDDVISKSIKAMDEILKNDLNKGAEDDNDDSLTDGWTNCVLDESPTEAKTKLYIFGRTDREKEDWFRRLLAATHVGVHIPNHEAVSGDLNETISSTLLATALTENEYLKYMASVMNLSKKVKDESTDENAPEEPNSEVAWVNALLSRVLFDCMRNPSFTARLKDRIQRKLSSIKLPYFIEELSITELNLGKSPPLFYKVSKPSVDQRGLWVELEMRFEGLVILTLTTKLNLMKLKQPHQDNEKAPTEKSAMFNSDIDDSAESSSDEDSAPVMQNSSPLDASGNPVAGLGGSSNTSKKFIKMVDKIAESKFFQAATEYKYIKKAMVGVSNTDLRLTVEIRALNGTLVLNVPPPPNDRIWIGFRPVPDLQISAHPIVGERNITFLHVTSWIEKKLVQEFQKVMVIPNMEDFIIPVMISKLPE